MSREKTALNPSSVTSQPITSRLSGQVCSPEPTMAGPSPSVESSAPAAPSPNSAVATILLFDQSSRRKANAQSSTVRNSTVSPGAAGLGCSAREPDDAAGAAEPKDRKPAYRAPQPHPFDQQRIEARRRDPGRRDDDDAVDLAFVAAGMVEELPGRRFEQIECGREIDAVALCPAVRLIVPFDRHAGVARANSGVGKDRQ